MEQITLFRESLNNRPNLSASETLRTCCCVCARIDKSNINTPARGGIKCRFWQTHAHCRKTCRRQQIAFKSAQLDIMAPNSYARIGIFADTSDERPPRVCPNMMSSDYHIICVCPGDRGACAGSPTTTLPFRATHREQGVYD